MKHLDYTLQETLRWWDSVDKGGTDLAGIRALCLVDRFYLLVKVCGRKDMLHPWLYERCREVEKDPDGHIDLWAREHYKSTIITFAGVIQEVLKNPEITICIFSHTNPIATDFLRQIKTEFENNQTLISAFPDIFYNNPAKQAQRWSVEGGIVVKRRSNPKEATIEASGLVDGQPISKHYQLRVYDDTVTDKSVSTPEQVQKTTNSYSLSQSLGTVNGREWMIGTRYSYADTYDWILTREALKPRIYAVTKDGTVDGPLVLFTKKEWADRKQKLTDHDIACQYYQNPLSGQQRMFNIEDLMEYEVRPETLNVYIMVDPARSKKKGSANTAVAVVGVDYALNKYLLDGFNHKMNLKERWEAVSQMYVRWKQMPGIQMVKVGYESYGAQADMDYFEEQMQLPNKPKFTIEELKWPRDGEGSKDDRVQRLVPDMKSHKIFVPLDTDEKNLTELQRRMKNAGYEYRIARPIHRLDEDRAVYDLKAQLKIQLMYYPFGTLKDLADALSRIYDMDIMAPQYQGPVYAEPAIP